MLKIPGWFLRLRFLRLLPERSKKVKIIVGRKIRKYCGYMGLRGIEKEG